MDPNRSYNQRQRFPRHYQQNTRHTPYNRGHSQRNNQQFNSRQYHNNDRYRNRNRFDRPGQSQEDERTFDARGREVTGFQGYNKHLETQVPIEANVQLTPLEEKAKHFLKTVLSQEGVRSQLIFIETTDNAVQTFRSTVDQSQLQIFITENETDEYVLKIGQEEIVRGKFASKQLAKSELAEQAMTILKKDCFYIIKKKEYEDVTTKNAESKQAGPEANYEGSKAHQMMLKMGWGGKGLGINEQGGEKTVAETIDQNVSREGLGSDNVFKKIHTLLEEYSKSGKMSLLRFEPDFTSEERAHIHKIARKFGLKSKSEGKGEDRRITITKKLDRGELVYNLLTSGLENTLYQLIIPPKFVYLWQDDDDEDNEEESAPHFLS